MSGRVADGTPTRQTEEVRASFVEPMLLQPQPALPDGSLWLYEVKFDGYRAIAFKTSGRVHLRSRNNNDFNAKYPSRSAPANVPEKHAGRWGQSHGSRMAECHWLKPVLSARFEFLERTSDGHLWHSLFVGLRESIGS